MSRFAEWLHDQVSLACAILLYKTCGLSPLEGHSALRSLFLFTSKVPGVLASLDFRSLHCISINRPSSTMHPQVFLLALAAPLAFSLPQPIPPSGASVASGNSTGGGEGGHYEGKHHGPPGGRFPERDLTERQESGNSTGGAGERRPHDFKGTKHHSGPPHTERDLGETQESGNSTGGAGEARPHDFEGKKYHSGPPHPERDLGETQESGNSTGGAGKGRPHDSEGEKSHGGPPHPERDLGDGHEPGNVTSAGGHHHGGHPGPKVDKRIEEANGTAGGDVGKEKFKPDGHHGGPRRPGEQKRSIIDMVLHRRRDNSTSSGEEWEDKHKEGHGHFEHEGPE